MSCRKTRAGSAGAWPAASRSPPTRTVAPPIRPNRISTEDAANAVFNSLVKTYGHDIACKAFKAGIGHQTNGQWDHSWNHPITGRHVQKMLSTAQSELKADNSAYRQMAFQPFKGPAGETLTRGSSLMWFQQSATLKESPDAEFWQNAGLRHDLRRLEYRQPKWRPRLRAARFRRTVAAPGGADRLQLQARLDPNHKQDFWQLDVRWPEATQASAIGIRIDRENPKTVYGNMPAFTRNDCSTRHTSRACRTAAVMKPANNGCGSNGFDFSSGWYCTPTNQG